MVVLSIGELTELQRAGVGRHRSLSLDESCIKEFVPGDRVHVLSSHIETADKGVDMGQCNINFECDDDPFDASSANKAANKEPQMSSSSTWQNRDSLRSSHSSILVYEQRGEKHPSHYTQKPPAITWSESVVEQTLRKKFKPSKETDVSRPRRFQSLMLSSIYGVLIVTLGSTFCVADRVLDKFHAAELFSIVIVSVGLLCLASFHVDILWYKHSASRQVRSRVRPSQSGLYVHSAASVFSTYARKVPAPRLWFLSGRHSGSFYLKGGMVVFCFCHLVNQGLLLQSSVESVLRHGLNIKDGLNIIFHVLRPVYSFYQLFMAFKYSNIVINHASRVTRFGLMHMIGTCLYFWFSSIVQEYRHSLYRSGDDVGNDEVNGTHHFPDADNRTVSAGRVLDTVSITPYLHPFTIEYNIVLAGVWFIVWQNVGTEPGHHFARRESLAAGAEPQQLDANYHSNLVVSADCHAANKGLFAGFFLLLSAIVTLVIAQVVFSGPEYQDIESVIFLVQDTALVLVSLLAVVWAYVKISKLDFNVHPITLLDDVLLYVPLPFYFIYYFMSMTADVWYRNHTSIVSNVLVVAQVVLQTMFISDGLRRCSNSRRHRFTKPGREMVTFLIICNVTVWVTNTFNMEKYHMNPYVRKCFGEDAWVMVKHATFPLMLFYRFHASVCLADIWKSAYESGE